MSLQTSKGHILVVEDDADNRALIGFLLEGAGFTVTAVSTCAEAALIQTALTQNASTQTACHADQGNFDLYLIDNLLPDCAGLTFCREIRRYDLFTPVVFLSVVAEPAAQQAALEAGADAYLIKPHDTPKLVERVTQLIAANKRYQHKRRARINESKPKGGQA